MKTMKAIKTAAEHQGEIQEVPIPAIRDDYGLKHIDIVAPPGETIGCDFAGVVEDVGSKVEKVWKRGDRIAGFTQGGNEVQPEDGCAAEYCVAKGDLGMKIPDHMTDEEACTLGVGITIIVG
ncbi:hypothetical protein MMC11_002872 [Xylographa trunciseda]|nr:hypothetical protein [Xylographa trunciseda]